MRIHHFTRHIANRVSYQGDAAGMQMLPLLFVHTQFLCSFQIFLLCC